MSLAFRSDLHNTMPTQNNAPRHCVSSPRSRVGPDRVNLKERRRSGWEPSGRHHKCLWQQQSAAVEAEGSHCVRRSSLLCRNPTAQLLAGLMERGRSGLRHVTHRLCAAILHCRLYNCCYSSSPPGGVRHGQHVHPPEDDIRGSGQHRRVR